MVQMKGCLYRVWVKKLILLYIPHGSDESYYYDKFILSYFFLYIPHGSDERWWRRHESCHHHRLYIPHGSDERLFARALAALSYFFISHMVQMKAASLAWPVPFRAILYIPHGSDESFVTWIGNACYLILYIPHGSDERWLILSSLRLNL